jgi:hypothetical protein
VTADLVDAVDAVTAALDARDLDKARTLFDEAVQGQQEGLDRLVRRLAATVVLPPGLVVWGFGIDVWANPHRFDYATRCGGCRWTASNYVTERAARVAAERHVAEDHRGRPFKVVCYSDDAYWVAVDAAEDLTEGES